MKNVLGLLMMMFVVSFWMGCEKDPVDPNNNNNNSGSSGYSMTKISGDNQTDTINLQLSQALKVKVQDSLGAATQGVSVNFSVSSGGGSLSAATVTTDANGFAEVLWTLGAATGTQTVSATASVTVGSPLSFSATALAASTGGVTSCTSTFTDARDGEVY